MQRRPSMPLLFSPKSATRRSSLLDEIGSDLLPRRSSLAQLTQEVSEQAERIKTMTELGEKKDRRHAAEVASLKADLKTLEEQLIALRVRVTKINHAFDNELAVLSAQLADVAVERDSLDAQNATQQDEIEELKARLAISEADNKALKAQIHGLTKVTMRSTGQPYTQQLRFIGAPRSNSMKPVAPSGERPFTSSGRSRLPTM